MIHDLLGLGERDLRTDFLIIGAGTVGLPTSVLLSRDRRLKVVCLESGGRHQDKERHPLNDVVQVSSFYRGAEEGRFRCLGGTSTRWGGALIPFQAADIDPAIWPISFEDLKAFIPEVESLFSLEAGPYSDPNFPFVLGERHVNTLAKWPRFTKRNVYNLLREECESSDGPEVWLNATVTKILVTEGGLVEVEAVSERRDRLRVTTKNLIIAAGAIETTRLALLLDQQNGGAITAVFPKLGCYFSDHLSVEVAEILPKNLKAIETLNLIFGFRFGAFGTMRNLRFELVGGAELRNVLRPSFAHVSFANNASGGGFEALRECFRKLQMRRLPPISVLLSLIQSAPWLATAVWWRFVKRRLLFPKNPRLMVHMVIEQKPREQNRISLSTTKHDVFGLPLAEISWSICEEDVEMLTRSTDAFQATWQSSKLASLADWSRRESGLSEGELSDGGGTCHPTGSTRMSQDPTDGAVDRDLRLHAFKQIQLLSTSVLPTGGGANPTMMLMLLAMRCIKQHRCRQ